MKHGNEWIHMANIWRGDQNYNWMVQNLRGANGMENKYVISCHKNCLFFCFLFLLFLLLSEMHQWVRDCVQYATLAESQIPSHQYLMFYKSCRIVNSSLVYFEIQLRLDKHGVSGTVKKPRLHDLMLKPKLSKFLRSRNVIE